MSERREHHHHFGNSPFFLVLPCSVTLFFCCAFFCYQFLWKGFLFSLHHYDGAIAVRSGQPTGGFYGYPFCFCSAYIHRPNVVKSVRGAEVLMDFLLNFFDYGVLVNNQHVLMVNGLVILGVGFHFVSCLLLFDAKK